MALRLGELSTDLVLDDAEWRRRVDAAERRYDRFGDHIKAVGQQVEAQSAASGGEAGAQFSGGFAGRVRAQMPGLLQTAILGVVGGAFSKLGERIGERLFGGGGQELKVEIDQTALVRDIHRAMETAEHTKDLNIGVSKLGMAGIAGAAGLAGAALSTLGGGAAAASGASAGLTGSLSGLVVVIGLLGAAAALVGPAVSVMGAAIGALPAVAAGAAAGIGALVVGFMGIAAHFKKTSAAGGGAAVSLDQVASAERRLARSQEEALRAQRDLDEARAAYGEDMEDLDRSLRRAQLSERQATRALAEAQKDLDKARRGGNVDKIAEARDAYDDAALSVEEAKDRTSDLTTEQRAAADAGVDGSARVQQALDRQRAAVDAVTDAETALRQARQPTGGGGGAAEELPKIAASAMATVAAIKALAPQWDRLRLSVQQRLFAGVADEISALATVWMPVLEARLGGFADTSNGIFKTLSKTMRDPAVVGGLSTGMEAVRGVLEKVGNVAAGPLVTAFSQLSSAAAPFLDKIGDKLAGGLTAFADWIGRMSSTGQLEAFFTKAGDFFGDLWDMGGDLGTIIGGILGALMGGEEQAGETSFWDTLKGALATVAAWFEDPQHMEMITGFFSVWIGSIGVVIGMVSGMVTWVTTLVDAIGAAIGWITDKFGMLVDFVTALPGRIGKAASGMWDGIKNSFRAAINWIIGAWNRLSFHIPSIDTHIPGIGRVGGMTLNLPDIPMLASGGDITRAGMAVIAERGPETVYLPAGASVRPGRPDGGGTAGQPVARVEGQILIRGDGILSGLRETIAVRGGNVQAVLGG